MKKLYGEIMNSNEDTRVTTIVEEEIIEDIDNSIEEIKNDEQRDEVFENLKIALIEKKRLL